MGVEKCRLVRPYIGIWFSQQFKWKAISISSCRGTHFKVSDRLVYQRYINASWRDESPRRTDGRRTCEKSARISARGSYAVQYRESIVVWRETLVTVSFLDSLTKGFRRNFYLPFWWWDALFRRGCEENICWSIWKSRRTFSVFFFLTLSHLLSLSPPSLHLIRRVLHRLQQLCLSI
jgi:hypothetical protein